MPTEYPPDENSYFIDAESATETARLMLQDRLLTRCMGPLFPESADPSTIHDVLDIACGPGGWILDVAHTYPKIQAVGIDISRTTIAYAQAQARVQALDNASFQVMNALQPLSFSDRSFDLVNARLIHAFMPKEAWPRLLHACFRITRPGGIIRLTECEEFGISNSPAREKMDKWTTQAMWLVGQTFSPDGTHSGITPLLGRFLRAVGYQKIEHRAYVIDYSQGTEAHNAFYQNLSVGSRLLEPFLLKVGVTTAEEFEQVYQQMQLEMQSDDFCALFFLVTVSGEKPV